MSSTFFGLNVASSGLTAFMASINTSANNVSNVQTEGYSKQVVNKEASSALRAFERYGNVGTGVVATDVSRMRDSYYDKKYWTNESKYGFYERKEYYMQQVEDYYTDSAANPGFSTVFATVFNSLNAVKSNAGDTAIRSQFISDTQKLCTYFNSTSQRLNQLQISVNDEVKTTVDQINAISKKLALLTKQINAVEMNKGYANELRDQRALLCDELSQIVAIDVSEGDVINSNYPNMDTGATYFTVKLNGQLLVDSYDFYELATVTRENKYNQSDVEGLYDVVWAKTGVNFDVYGDNQYGTLRGLFEVRDGNDSNNLKGRVTATDNMSITLGSIAPAINKDINYMSLPESGQVTVNNKDYLYDDFEFVTDEDGNITSVTFHLHDGLTSGEREKIEGAKVTAGETVAFKGIAYYQNQMNAFLRSFTSELNDMQLKGIDFFGDDGQVVFTADDAVTNREGNFDDHGVYDDTTHTYLHTCTDDTYYRLTAGNVQVSTDVLADPRLLSATYKRFDEGRNKLTDGQDSADLVKDMLKLEKDVPLFRGGGASSFLQCIYADITVDTQECSVFKDNYAAIEKQISLQRASVSGVDEDEEALDLVKFQNAYNLNSKVISVLSELYDQLILRTGV